MSVLHEARAALWPSAGDRHGPLVPMLIGLTLVTGVVDAASYLSLGHVLVANMTGNVVFLGFALAGAGGIAPAASLTALGSFLIGALAGGWLGARTASHRGHLLRAANVAQVALMSVALLVSLLAATPPDRAARYAQIAALALAMGVQNAAAQRLAVPDLTTTVLTKTLTGLVSEASVVGGSGARVGRRAAAVGAMLVGALIGGLLVLKVSVAAAIATALGLVVLVALSVHLASRGRAPWTSP